MPLHIAKPYGERAFFRSAKAALRKLHRAGICHNDLAKEQNWLRGRDGRAYLTDFQLAARFSRRSWLFRVAAYEDLRHLLKHKRRYAPERSPPRERRVLASKSLLTRIWMATGKKVYYWITRGVLRFTDREGGGPRLVHDAPRIAQRLKSHPQVRETVVGGVSRPPRRHRPLCLRRGRARAHRGQLARIHRRRAPHGLRPAPRPPEHLQVIDELPRAASGEVRSEILQLVAMNQVDLIDPLIASEQERRSSLASSPTAATCATASRSSTDPYPSPCPRPTLSAKNPRRPPRRAPDQPLPPPGRDLRPARTGRSRARSMRASVGAASATGSKAGMTDGRRSRDQFPRFGEMTAGATAQARLSAARNCGRRVVRSPRPGGSPVPLQDLERHEQLAARGVDRKRLEQPGDAHGPCRRGDRARRYPGRHRREFAPPARSGWTTQHPHRLRGPRASPSARRRDRTGAPSISALNGSPRQPVARDGREQRRRHRIGLDLAAACPVENVAPPLQPDLACQRARARPRARARSRD